MGQLYVESVVECCFGASERVSEYRKGMSSWIGRNNADAGRGDVG